MAQTTNSKLMKNFWKLLSVLVLVLVQAQAVLSHESPSALEEKAAQYFESIRSQPLLMIPFLREMPKGGDLHNHLSGAIYAESFILWAAEDDLCVSQKTFVLTVQPCDADSGRPPVRQALTDPTLYRQIIDAWSMRNSQFSGQSGHDHFFDTFGRFSLVTGNRVGDMLAEQTMRAAHDRLSYVELLITPDGRAVADLGKKLGWDSDFNRMRQKLLANGLKDEIAGGRKFLDEAEARRRTLRGCGTPKAQPGCEVAVRYLYQVGRGGLPEQVFAQILAGFEMATSDARVVGLNLVQPEDWYVPMRDFTLHMRIIEYLRPLYPKVRVTLHAGELVPGMVPPEGLRFHIRQSVEIARAERIGHGVDIMWEDDPLSLIKKMAERNVMVEICLTSNDAILGIRGKQHPLALYLKYGVPVALATDDQGVARSDMTGEYLKAAVEQELGYLQLKTMARTSLEYAFVAGASLWQDAKSLTMVRECSPDDLRQKKISNPCQRFLNKNEKAELEYELEKAFIAFEQSF